MTAIVFFGRVQYDGRTIHRLTANAVRRQRDDALPPHLRDKLLAEEKRLAYVGCTRAMERLYIVSSQV